MAATRVNSTFAEDAAFRLHPIRCHSSFVDDYEFEIICSAPYFAESVSSVLIAAMTLECDPKSYSLTSEIRELAFLGTVMAEATFECE